MPTLAQKLENNRQAISALTAVDSSLLSHVPISDLGSGGVAGKLKINRLLAAYAVCQGRLTLESGAPVSITDQTAKSTILFLPYKGNGLTLFDGTRWRLHQLDATGLSIYTTINGQCTLASGSNEITLKPVGPPDAFTAYCVFVGMQVTGTGIPANTVVTGWNGTKVTLNNNATDTGDKTLLFKCPASTIYDVVGLDVPIGLVGSDSSTPVLALIAWTNATTRANALSKQDGVDCLTSSATYGGVAYSGAQQRLIGTIRTTTTAGETEDSKTKRFVWNNYNQVLRRGFSYNSTASWTYTTAAWRVCNNGTGQVYFEFVLGKGNPAVETDTSFWISGTNTGYIGTAFDGVSPKHYELVYNAYVYAGPAGTPVIALNAGYHYGVTVETSGGATPSFYGYGSSSYAGYCASEFALEM